MPMGPGWWIADLNRILSAGLPSLNLILDEAEGLPVEVQLVSDCTPFEQADTLVLYPDTFGMGDKPGRCKQN